MCQACFSDCTVSRKYVKKEMNVYADQLRELQNLPFAIVKRDEAVLKEDVAGLYQTTWELFVKDTAARAIQRYLCAPDSRPHSSSPNAYLFCNAKGY